MYCIRASTSILSYDGNTISSNSVPNNTGATSASIYGFYDASSPVTESYTNNNINNLTITGSSTATGNIIYGMYILTASGVKTISGNNINNLTFTSSGAGYAGVYGINDAYASTANIFKNVIHTLSSSGTGAGSQNVRGISFGTSVGTTYNVYDNIVGNLTAPQSTGFNLVGIFCGSVGTTYNVSYNTVYLNATSSASGSASSALYMSSTTPTVNLIDNILVNLSTGTTSWLSSAIRRTSTTLTAYGTTSNYNSVYAGTPSTTNVIYYDGTTSYQTLATFKTQVSPRETASISETISPAAGVYFQSFTGPATGLSTTFLHINPAVSTQVSNGGINISGITNDFDGDIRQGNGGYTGTGTAPDIGADEYEFIPPSGVDIGAFALVTPATSGCFSNVQTIVIRVQNYGSAIDFSLNPATVTCNVTGTATATLTGTLTSILNAGSFVDITLTGTFDMSVNGPYTFNAFTSCASDATASNDAMTAATRTRTGAVAGTLTSSQSNYCVSGTPTLTITGNANGTSQWQESTVSAGGPWTNITGTNTYTPAFPLTQTTYYRVETTCIGVPVQSNVVTVTVVSPAVTGTNSPLNLCGQGSVTFTATGSAGTTLNWYAAAVGGTPLASGGSYNTPVISSTTSYWVSASIGGTSGSAGRATPFAASTGFNGNDYGLVFDATQAFTLTSVDVYATTATGAITIELENGAGTVIQSAGPFTLPAATGTTFGGGATPTTLTLNFNIPVGTNYRLQSNAHSGSIVRDNPITGTFSYPLPIGPYGSITGGLLGGAANANTYYYFYNLQYTAGCESPRTQVTVNVGPAPSITPSTPLALVCSTGATTLNVSSSNAGYTYTWTPGNLTGASVSVNPATSTTYTVTALDNSGGAFNGCTTLSTIAITAQPTSATVNGSPESICAASGSSVLSLTPASYSAGSIQWQNSPTGAVYTDIGGATGNTYSTGTISSSTYYKALIKDGNNTVCLQPIKEIVVGVPSVTGTTPNTRCGTGTTSLQATGSAGATMKWYTTSTGGASIGSGSPFTTPVINNTTTFYVGAETGSGSPTAGIVGAGATTSATYSNPFYSAWSNTHNQHLILASELYAAGMSSGLITAGGINITSAGTLPMIDFSIKMANTSAVNLATYISPTFITVYTSPSVMPIVGVNAVTFTTPFTWDGVSNLVIEICHGNPSSTATMSRTCSMDATSFISTIHTQTSAATSAAVQCANTTTNLLTYSTRPQFYFTYLPACSSTRTAVVATVTPGPAITVNASTTAICPGGSATIGVSSVNDPDYSYVWTSNPAGYSNTGAGPHTVSPSVTTTYIVTATDNSGGANQGCAMIDSLHIINGGTLVAGTVASSQNAYCLSGSPLLTSTGASGGAFQWQSSTISSSGPWTNVGTGATTYSPGTITQTTYYQMVTSCQASSVTSNVATVTVNNPTLTSTTPGARCGTGTVTLGATTSAASINWYTAASGGTAIATGNSFTTPVLSTTTNYYASAVSSGGSTQISSNGVPTVTTSTQNGGLQFTLNVDVVLNSIQVYSTAAGTATVTLENSANTVLFTSSAMPIVASNLSTPQTLTLGWPIAAGVGYHIKVANTGNNLGYASGAFPAPMGNGVGTITSGWLGSSTNSLNYFVYNMNTTSGCESARTAITATVTSAPVLNIVAGDLGLCNGGSTTLGVNSANDPNYTYSWTSAPAGFVQSGNGPFTITPSATTKYYVDALDNSGGANNGCVKRDSVTVTVTGVLTAGTASSSVSTFCVSGTPTMTLAGYDGSIQWQSSTVSAGGPWTNVGTGLATYTPGAPITQTTYYQAVVSCSGSSVTSNVETVTVNNPQITGTTPNSRCGAGTVNLGATGTSGSSINWYAASTGGAPIGSGTTFTTPVITTTTNFYAAANNGFTTYSNTVGYSNTANYNFITQDPTWGLFFTANVACTFDSVAVYPTGTGTISIKILSTSNTILFSGPTVNISGAAGTQKVFVPVGAVLAAGNYKIGMAYTGVTNLGSQPTGSAMAYPFVSSIATVTAGSQGSGPVANVYYWFYDLTFSASTGCEGARVAVPATVTPSPNITASATFLTPCAGNPTSLSVSSSNDPNYTYTWTSTPAGFNQTGSGPLTATPSVTTTYHVLAVDNTSGTYAGCGAATDITITPTANPLSVSAASTPSAVCPGGNAQLNTTVTIPSNPSSYSFSVSNGTYTPISGGTVLASGAWDDSGPGIAIPLGFSFNYNGVSYTTCNINLNGYISFGTTTTTTDYAPISTLVTNEVGIIAAFARDIQGVTGTGEVRYLSSGGVFTVQWSNARRYIGTTVNTESFNFQLKIYQTTNHIQFVYGTFSDAISATTVLLPQIGLRGASTSDFKNLEVLINGNWASPTLGTVNTQTCYYNQGAVTTKPASGLTYTFSPPVASGGYAYDWSANSNFLSNTNTSNPIAQAVTSTQAYTVVVTQSSTGCTKSSTVNLAVNPPPDALASSNAPVCAGFPLTLFGTNNDGSQVNTGWSWSGPSFTSTSQNPNISNASAANSGTYTLTITNSFGCTSTSSTDVIVNPNPVLSIGTQTNVSCNGLSDGSVDLDATNGTSPYLFDLVGPSTPDGIFTGLAAGTYTATVNDDNGCAATSLTVTITEPPVLTVSAGSNTPVCSGTSLNLTSSPVGGTSGYSYAWTGPNGPVPAVQNPTIASATAADAGQYDVLITDAHGCTSTGSHTVQVNAAPTAAIALSGSPNKCLGQSATVQLTFTGTGPWNYTITGNGGPYSGSTSSNPAIVNVTPIAGGVHTYTITAVGNTSCPTGGTTSGSATVNVSTVPPPSSGPVPAGAAEACVGSVMLITSNVIAGQNIIYSWNTGSNSSTVLFSTNIGGPFTAGPFQTNTNQVYVQFGALAGGQSGYQVCLQGVNGCGSSINKCLWIRGVVSGPGAITPANQVVACPNDVKSYSCGTSAGASVYSWTLGGSATPVTSGQGTQNVQVTFPPAFVSGQLCVTAALACGGSSTSPARCMSISKTPANANVPTGAATVCPGATGVSYSIPAVAGATGYNWTVPANATIATGTNSPSITVNFPTPYNGTSTVCVTTTSACGTSAVKCKNVASGIPNQPAGITGPLTNVCGSTVQYSVVNPIASSYTWTNPAGTTISGSATGSTILLNVSSTFTSGVLTVAANSTLCPPATSAPRTSSTIWGRPNNPGAITANPSVWCSGGFVNFFVTPASPLPSYNWTVSNGTIDAGQGSSIIDVTWGANAAGTVSVNASNTCGQSAGTSSQNFSAGCREEGTSSATDFSVYPNPTSGKTTLSLYSETSFNYTLKVIDYLGRVILSNELKAIAGENTQEVDMSHLAKGMYMIEVAGTDHTQKVKVIVQ